MNRYRNIKINGFDSKAEYIRFLILEQEEKEGVIKGLERQRKFLICSKTERVKKSRDRYYIADFFYFDKRKDAFVIEDVKSPITRKDPVYSLKKQIVLSIYKDYVFREVEYSKGGFEVHDYDVFHKNI